MRAVVRSLFVLGATALCAATSGAAVLPFTGSLTIGFAVGYSVGGELPPVTVQGSGVATTNGPGSHLATLALPASPFATTGLLVPVTDPAQLRRP